MISDFQLFTFHYVSINIASGKQCAMPDNYLHSTMYLLISFFHATPIDFLKKFTFHYVSINIKFTGAIPQLATVFTFHYVSINMIRGWNINTVKINLHSTMYLLISIEPRK